MNLVTKERVVKSRGDNAKFIHSPIDKGNCLLLEVPRSTSLTKLHFVNLLNMGEHNHLRLCVHYGVLDIGSALTRHEGFLAVNQTSIPKLMDLLSQQRQHIV